ncbi:hypothetical protein AB0E69_16730 [Kribbella sp. NPDC026611]|uniref:hypothetical protein n=1 Tax=Kribbella sp. NPDC026611 TaxID=3154911 RepID=UPI0033EA37B9
MLRWVGAAAVGLLVLTGCTVPIGGVSGVTVDANGKPVIVIQMCEGHVDTAVLYLPDPDPDRAFPKDKTIGHWETDAAVTGFSQFSVETGGNGWRPVGQLAPRELDAKYSAYGGTKDNSWSTGYIDFSIRDLATLKPGTVRVLDPHSGDPKLKSLEDFKQKSCENWDQ